MTVALGACSLAGDITPPPGLATAQAQGFGLAPTAAPLVPPARSPDLTAGALIFADKCAPCHGDTGAGDGAQAAELPSPPVAFTDPEVAQRAIPEEWFRVVTEGRFDRFMPGFTSLDDGQRWDVVGYALSLGLPAQAVDAGRLVYQQQCAGCHGDVGKGDGRVPDLTSPEFQAERSSLALYGAVTNGVGEAMPAYGESLGEDDRWAVAAFVRSGLVCPRGRLRQPPRPWADRRRRAETTQIAEGTGIETAAAATVETAQIAEGTALETATDVAAATGSVTGRVQNGTAGASPPSGLEVTLHGFDGDSEAFTQSTIAAADGRFSFDGLERTPGRVYVATTDFGGALYASEIGELPAETLTLELPLTVYKSTSATDALRVSRLHLLFDFPAEDILQVVELWLLSNLGDQTIAGSDEGAIEVALPAGATGLSLDGGVVGERFELTDSGFRDRREVVPGQNTSELVFSYNLPYDRRLEFARDVGYPIEAVVAMVATAPPFPARG
jgi:mono/diheme cytochrome c family protein